MMASKEFTVGLLADHEDIDVSVEAIEHALAECRARHGVGRPTGSDKERITIRLDKEVLERFRTTGPGWQSRVNEALRNVKVT